MPINNQLKTLTVNSHFEVVLASDSKSQFYVPVPTKMNSFLSGTLYILTLDQLAYKL